MITLRLIVTSVCAGKCDQPLLSMYHRLQSSLQYDKLGTTNTISQMRKPSLRACGVTQQANVTIKTRTSSADSKLLGSQFPPVSPFPLRASQELFLPTLPACPPREGKSPLLQRRPPASHPSLPLPRSVSSPFLFGGHTPEPSSVPGGHRGAREGRGGLSGATAPWEGSRAKWAQAGTGQESVLGF